MSSLTAKDLLLDIIIILISVRNSFFFIFNMPFMSKPDLNVISYTTSHKKSFKGMVKVLLCEKWYALFSLVDAFLADRFAWGTIQEC